MRRWMLVVVIAASMVRPAWAGLAEHPEVAAALRLFELWAEDQRRYLGQPGLSMALVDDQELVWARGFGVADLASGRPARPDTVYRLGSISKVFTATAVVELGEAGKLSLDDPVTRYLPELRTKEGQPPASRITLRHLLTHTSGLPREAAFPYWTDRKFPSTAAMIAAVLGQENLTEAGTRYRYSNLGIALAGEAASRAAGKPYPELVAELILRPLGLLSTFVEAPTLPAERLATGYLIRRPDGSSPPAPFTNSAGLTPAANLSSSVEDLARFVSAHLTAANLREMHRVQWLAPDWGSGRGLGFALSRQGSRTLVGHAGWVAGHRSQLTFDPVAKIGFIILTNSDEGGPGSYVRQAVELLFPALERATAPPSTPSPPLVAGERYTGSYRDPWGATTEVLLLNGRLALWDHDQPPTSDVLGSVTYLKPVGEHRFVMEGSDDPVLFELDREGRVERIKTGENYIFPVACREISAELTCVR